MTLAGGWGRLSRDIRFTKTLEVAGLSDDEGFVFKSHFFSSVSFVRSCSDDPEP